MVDALRPLPSGFHLAVIMDGNGRWGEARGLSRVKGHEQGMKRVDELFRTATDLGVEYLTLFAFSTENWKRSETEVSGLMRIFGEYMLRETERLLGENVVVRFIGDKSAFTPKLIKGMERLERDTADNTGLKLFVAMNYGGRDEILRVTRSFVNDGVAADDISADAFEARLDTHGAPPVDLLIRTSGEQRISNFVIWQAAYAELYFSPLLWPDFDGDALREAIMDFQSRERRFGKEKA